jgi:hypothetical protein
MINSTIPFQHFDVLRDFCKEFGLDFNLIYNGVNTMYKKRYTMDNKVYSLADVPKEAFLEALYSFKTHNLFGCIGVNLYIRPIMLPISNQVWASPVVNGVIFSSMLKSNNVFKAASIGLIKEGDTFSMSDNAIHHVKPKCDHGTSCSKENLCPVCSERSNKPVIGGYMLATLYDGQQVNHLISREVIDEAIYRTNVLAYGGLTESLGDNFVLTEAIFFYHLDNMIFYLAKLGKTSLLHKINKILSFKAKLIEKRARLTEQTAFLQSGVAGCHDRVLLKINEQA